MIRTLTCLALLCAAGTAWADGPVKLRVQNRDVPAGGSYFQPMNSEGNKIPLYSFDKTRYTFENTSDADVTVNSITFAVEGDNAPVEWSLVDAAIGATAAPELPVTVPAKSTWDFMITFYPIRGELRQATVTITYNGDQTYVFTAKGKGRPVETEFSPNIHNVWERCFGSDTTDEMTTGLASDEAGNLYFSGNVAQVVHVFNHDVFVGKVNADGSLAWVKAWGGKNQDYQRDPGQNAETGGSAGAIAYAGGHVYLALSSSPTTSNSSFVSVIVKLNAETGDVVWQKAFSPLEGVKIARESSEVYALDVADGRVYATGVAEGDAKLLFLALDDASGDVVFQKAIDVKDGSNDRAYAVKVDGHGGAYIGGLTNGRGLLVHLDGVTEGKPVLGWVKKISMGVGSNVNHVDVDADGNAYLSCDRRGAQTYLSAMRVNKDGEVAWATTLNAKGRGDRNNTHVVRVVGDAVYVGGKAAIAWYDTQQGDGFLAKLNKDTGAQEWAAFYYGGKGAEEIAEHRIKGIEVTSDGHLLIAGQVYTGPNNHEHFWGRWYLCKEAPGEFKANERTVTDETEVSKIEDLPATWGVRDANTLESFDAYVDLAGGKSLGEKLGAVTFQPLTENGGNGPDGETFLFKAKLGE